jgi:hypothetical protein
VCNHTVAAGNDPGGAFGFVWFQIEQAGLTKKIALIKVREDDFVASLVFGLRVGRARL